MFFGKKNKDKPNIDVSATQQQAPDSESHGELSRDSIAAVLRVLAEYALPTMEIPADEFSDRCEDLAKGVLLGTLVDDETNKPVEPRNVHREIRNIVREQRRAESKEYKNHRESAGIIVSDLVIRLRKSLSQAKGHDTEIVSHLEDMEQAVQSGNLQTIREVSSRTASRIREVITTQREKDQEALTDLSGQLQDMRSELDEARAQVQKDALTQLMNRGAFDETFAKTVEFSQVTVADLTMYMLDLDHFKQVNDTYGHPAGDAVLRSVSRQIIRTFPRKDDMAIRYGGEEFVVLCRNTGLDDAEMLGERLRSGIEALIIETDEIQINVTTSVGVAVLKQDETPEQFLKRTDEALYAAKRNGRNRVELG